MEVRGDITHCCLEVFLEWSELIVFLMWREIGKLEVLLLWFEGVLEKCFTPRMCFLRHFLATFKVKFLAFTVFLKPARICRGGGLKKLEYPLTKFERIGWTTFSLSRVLYKRCILKKMAGKLENLQVKEHTKVYTLYFLTFIRVWPYTLSFYLLRYSLFSSLI